MFAGAAREAVFSKAEVIRRVNADFVPVALKAALVNQPPDGEEGLLYREIGRSKPAPALWRVAGNSEVFNDKLANGEPGDLHEVKLTWHGFIEMNANRMTRLLLSARGSERLKFGSARGRDINEVANLPAGHRIDIASEVRFGILGESADPERVAADVAESAPK